MNPDKRDKYLRELTKRDKPDCHQRFHKHIGMTFEESLWVHTKRLLSIKSSTRDSYWYFRQKYVVYVATKDLAIRRLGVLYDDGSPFRVEYDSKEPRNKSDADYAKKSLEDLLIEGLEQSDLINRNPRLQKICKSWEVDCHHGWHASVSMTLEESIALHTYRLLFFGRSKRKGVLYYHGGKGGVYAYTRKFKKTYVGKIADGKLTCPVLSEKEFLGE